ncbi:MAG: hypothetical protein Q8P89_00675 [bacterium]|nr:hypothetical protein [bacterium]
MRTQVQQLGKLPVVVLPLEEYEKMREDLEMLRSASLAKRIKKARKEVDHGSVYTVEKVKKLLDLA